MMSDFHPLRDSQLQELDKADTAAYTLWMEHAKFAEQYARGHHLSDKLIALASGNYTIEAKMKAFIPEKDILSIDIVSICSEIKKYGQSKIQSENIVSDESEQLDEITSTTSALDCC
jgi:hypothetical protein